jgi:cytochrome b6-f complex iron-sulfur subunit
MTVQQSLRQQEFREVVDTSAAADRVAPLSRAATLELFKVGHEGINRREFLTYAWAGALALLTLESGLATYQFIYPRSPVNQFGGRFYLGAAADLPDVGGEPKINPEGRFFLVNTAKGPHALYNLCTHSWNNVRIKLWWDADRNNFQCPACGSQFCPDGDYILGPAPRSLDQFEIEVVRGREILARTDLTENLIMAPVVPSPDAEIVVNTGSLLTGPPSALTFPHEGITCLNT